jgi:hypothetical protein
MKKSFCKGVPVLSCQRTSTCPVSPPDHARHLPAPWSQAGNSARAHWCRGTRKRNVRTRCVSLRADVGVRAHRRPEPTPLSPNVPCEGPHRRVGQDHTGVTRKDSRSPAVSRHQRKDPLVSGPTPHSPVPPRKGLRWWPGQAASPSPRSARATYLAGRATAVTVTSKDEYE